MLVLVAWPMGDNTSNTPEGVGIMTGVTPHPKNKKYFFLKLKKIIWKMKKKKKLKFFLNWKLKRKIENKNEKKFREKIF